MRKSLKEYFIALGYWWLIVIIPIALDIIGICQLASGNQFIGIPSWVWFQVGFVLLLIIPFIAFHKVRVQRDKVLEAQQSLILTPHSWAIGLSGMTDYPNKPENAYWLRLQVSANAIDKPIDTLDLIIDGKTIPANQWQGKIATSFTVYFNVTDWKWKGKIQVDLQARIKGDVRSLVRVPVDFNVEPGGLPRYL